MKKSNKQKAEKKKKNSVVHLAIEVEIGQFRPSIHSVDLVLRVGSLFEFRPSVLRFLPVSVFARLSRSSMLRAITLLNSSFTSVQNSSLVTFSPLHAHCPCCNILQPCRPFLRPVILGAIFAIVSTPLQYFQWVIYVLMQRPAILRYCAPAITGKVSL